MHVRALTAVFVVVPAVASAVGLSDVAGRTRCQVKEGVQCCATGVVTFVSQWLDNSGIVALPDVPNGPGVWFSGEVDGATVASVQGVDALKAGMLVEISGITSHLGFAPGLRASLIRVLGERTLPLPPAHRLNDFNWGVMDNMRATMEGVLMDAANVEDTDRLKSFVRLQLLTPDGVFLAHVVGDVEKWRGLVDARLRLSGVAMSVFNIRGEFIGVQLEVSDDSDTVVVEDAPDVSSISLVSLSELLPYTPVAPDSHRRRVRGVLTLALDGKLVCLQSGKFSLWVKTDAAGLSPGDEVEAVGFPVLEGGMGTLVFAKVERIGHVGLPAPEKVGWAQLDRYPVRDDGSYENYDGRRVEMVGTLESLEQYDGLCRIALEVENVRVEAEVRRPVPQDLIGCALLRPRIRVTGVLSLVHEVGLPVGRMPAIVDRRLYVSSGDEIEVADDAALARFRREKALARGAYVILAAAVVFALFLLVRFLRYRADYRRLGILTEERKRMAGDLHDTVEQNLVAAKMLLKTAVSLSPDTPDEVKEAVATAQEILMSAKADIRETVFNLRNDELFGRKPEDVLKSMAKRINSHGVVKIRMSLRGLPASLPAARFSDMLYIINEAMTNAVKHGRAKTVMIVSDPLGGVSEGRRGFCLRVLNDGEIFDPATALGPESGHFGVAGMRERARRSGIGFSLGVEKGRVSVRLEVDE